MRYLRRKGHELLTTIIVYVATAIVWPGWLALLAYWAWRALGWL